MPEIGLDDYCCCRSKKHLASTVSVIGYDSLLWDTTYGSYDAELEIKRSAVSVSIQHSDNNERVKCLVAGDFNDS